MVRSYLPLRDTLSKDCSSLVQRMQKALSEMKVQIHRVISVPKKDHFHAFTWHDCNVRLPSDALRISKRPEQSFRQVDHIPDDYLKPHSDVAGFAARNRVFVIQEIGVVGSPIFFLKKSNFLGTHLVSPDFNQDEATATELVMPTPCKFISTELPLCSMIRPTSG